MHQIKIFKGLENELPELEAAVNDWLRNTAARIVNVFGNIAPQSGEAVLGNLQIGSPHRRARGRSAGEFACALVDRRRA